VQGTLAQTKNGLEPIGVEFFLSAPSQLGELSRSEILNLLLWLSPELGGDLIEVKAHRSWEPVTHLALTNAANDAANVRAKSVP